MVTDQKVLLQISQLELAVTRLQESLSQPQNSFIRDSVIKRFEFSFEMAWKLMQSLVLLEGKETVSPRQSIRLAAQLGLIDNPEEWLEYQQARNLT